MSPESFDPQVQAYLDGELDAGERLAFERRVGEDPALAAEVERLARLKQQVRSAFALPDDAAGQRVAPRHGRWRAAVAAALVFGMALGFALAHLTRPPDPGSPLVAGEATDVMTRVLLHVGTNDPDEVRGALTSARYILDDFADAGRSVRVHVVANGRGLDMFRREVTSFAAEIRELEQQYANIQFVTCQNTIDRFERAHRRPVQLLPGVLRVDSIVADIARKRVQGWLYIGV